MSADISHGGVAEPNEDVDQWRGLSIRVVLVDFVKSLVTLSPAVIAVLVFDVEPKFNTMWPFLVFGAWGVLSAVADIIRWLFTRYRITETEVERRTGVIVRKHRSVRRDRIRSIDTHAKLRHRLAGLRIVTIGAGQQTNAGEAAFVLDSLARRDAELLRQELLRERASSPFDADLSYVPDGEACDLSDGAAQSHHVEVFARFRPHWVLYNMFSVWAYLSAAGLLWGAYWLASTFGVNLIVVSSRWVNWDQQGWVGITIIGLIGGGLFGALSMGVNFFLGYWNFELTRVHTETTSFLRTRRGLLSTREVSRDESRVRGLSISEPLLWRWITMTDTNLMTTGLSIWDWEQPSAILPRGPRGIALDVSARVLGDPSPLAVLLPRHPRAALRRRLWWATAVTGITIGLVAVPVATQTTPQWVLWLALALWPLALLLALVAYRALGHAIVGDYVVMRSGTMNRTTSALRRDSVSTIAIRQSVLQRRLDVCTVATMTSAGWSTYEAPDVAADEATVFASRAAPGLVEEFLVTRP